MWIHRDKCEDSWSKAARNRQTFWPLLPQNHPSYLPPPLHPPHILHCQGDSARPCVPSPPVYVGPWRAAGAASESAASLLWKDDVSHVGKSAIEILLFLIIAALCMHVTWIHTWFGHHRLLCSLFNSDSDWLSVQLFLTGWRAVFTDDVNLQCPLSLRTRGCLDMTKEAVLQGLQT